MPYDYEVETSQGPVTITLDRQVDPKILAKSQTVRDAVAKQLHSQLSSTTTTPTTTEGVPGEGVQIPRSVDAPLEAAGATLGAAAALPGAAAGLGPVAPVVGAGLGGAMANRALDFMRGSPRAAAAAARAKLGKGGASPAATVAEETANAVGRGSVGEATGAVAVPVLGAAARAVGLSRPLAAGAAAAKGAAERMGIPLSAADITGSRTLAGIERTPSYFTFGSGIMQRFRDRQLGKAASATEGVVQSIAQTGADEITAGRLAQGGMRAAARGFRGDAEQLFRAFDEKIGPDPVVPTTQFRQAVDSALSRGQQTPYGPPGAARRFQGGETVVEPTGEVSAATAAPTAAPAGVPSGPDAPLAARRALETSDARISGLPAVPGGGAAPFQGEYAGQQPLETLIHEATAQEHIPWRLARDIEAQLGEIAFRRGSGPIGTIHQGQAGALYGAIRGDMDTFLSTPGREGERAELRQLKDWYASGKALFNESVVHNMSKRKGAMNPESIVKTAFRPGQVTDTQNYRLAVSDDVYQQSVGAWLQSLQAKATHLVGGRPVFSPGTFVHELGKYEQNNHLDVILGAAAAAQMRELTSVLSRLGTAERLAGNPSGTGQSVMSIQQLMPLLRLGPDAIAGGIGSAAAGLPGAVGALALPLGLAKAVTSQPGIDLLSQGFSGRLARPLIRGAAQLGAQAIPALPR